MSIADLFRQLSLLIGTPTVVLAGVAAVFIVVPRDWRVVLLGYAILTVMLSLLLSQVIPAEWALQQAIAGGLVAVLLYISAGQLRAPSYLGQPRGARWPRMASLTSFRLLAVGLAAGVFWVVRDSIAFPLVSPLFRDAFLWLGMISLMGLALHEEPLHAGLSLLTFLGATQLVLFTLVQRRMLVGILQGGQVLLGLAIAYLIIAQGLARPPSAEVDLADLDGATQGGTT
jgi:phosphate starvation-inducible membrane PsiE